MKHHRWPQVDADKSRSETRRGENSNGLLLYSNIEVITLLVMAEFGEFGLLLGIQ